MTHQNQASLPKGESWRGCGYFILIVLVFTLVIWKLIPLLFDFITVRWQRDVVGTLFVFLSGIGLYFLRQKKRILYALLEIVFALISTWLAINNIEDNPDIATWFTLAAAIYLIVRGLDNWSIGKREIETSDDTYFTILKIRKKSKNTT